jgi:hypothetical protein
MTENMKTLNKKVKRLENRQVSFMNNGTVTIVTMIVEISQIHSAVDLQTYEL